MPKPYDFGKVELDVEPESQSSATVVEDESPFSILLMGDFSGRTSRGMAEPLGNRRPRLIDRDNFDEVFGKIAPALGAKAGVTFGALDDFHPDRIYDRLEVFRALREMRERLSDPSTFASAAAQIAPAKPRPAPVSQRPAPMADILSGNLLDELIEATESRGTAPTRALDPFTAYVRKLVEPYIVAKADPKQGEWIAQVDAATSDQMGAILHHAQFQALEAAWRAVFLLVRGLETGEKLKLYLLDISREEVAQDLGAARDLRSTGLYRLLVEQAVRTPGADAWTLLIGNYTFSATLEDVGLLARIGMIARAAGAPFLAAAHSKVVGCRSFGETADPADWRKEADADADATWNFLREIPEAPYLGLAMPRFVLRLPYGKSTDPTERFAYEEMPAPNHEHYLWGNPAFACALLLGQSFARSGWDMHPGDVRKVSGLPLHLYKEDGETRMKPCAEAFLTETAAEVLIEKGLMALVSLKNQDTVQLVRFQSVAKPEKALAGRWG